MHKLIPVEQRDSRRKWKKIGGLKKPHPSLRRQYKLARVLLEKIYTRMLEKVDPERGRLMKESSFVLEMSRNTFRFSPRAVWLKKNIENQLYKEWSSELIDEWLHAITLEIGSLDPRMKDWIFALLENWIFRLVTKEHETVFDKDKILILSGN
jgi:hypothetical protein